MTASGLRAGFSRKPIWSVAREDLALEAAYWGQLPGLFQPQAPQSADHEPQFRGDVPVS